MQLLLLLTPLQVKVLPTLHPSKGYVLLGDSELWRGGVQPRAGGGNRSRRLSREEGISIDQMVAGWGGRVHTAGIAITDGVYIPCDTLVT